MDTFIARIRKYFETLNAMESRLSSNWNMHANRRTLLVIILLGILGAYAYLELIRPPDSFPTDDLVTIPAGSDLKDTSEFLQKNNVVRSALAFRIMVILMGHERDLKAGDYQFKEPETVFHIARVVSIGAYGLEPIKVRIPEGANARQIATLLSPLLPRFDSESFLLQAEPAEGHLFPDTYFFLPNATEATVLQTMRQNFDAKEATIDAQVQTSGHTLEDIVIMASIVEREARSAQDRRHIAGVLWNRIAKGMPLQSDVTLVFTLNKSDAQLTMADLQSDSPYNTYKNKGLPPGAIGNPSLDSLLAAATPIPSKDLFYLADEYGVTHYCPTYACQLRNESMYLGYLRK